MIFADNNQEQRLAKVLYNTYPHHSTPPSSVIISTASIPSWPRRPPFVLPTPFSSAPDCFLVVTMDAYPLSSYVLLFLFVTLFAYLCFLILLFPIHTRHPALMGTRIVYGLFLDIRFARSSFFFPLRVGILLRFILQANIININIHTDTNIGVVVLIILHEKHGKDFWVHPNTAAWKTKCQHGLAWNDHS